METSTTVTGLIECHHSADTKNVIEQISVDCDDRMTSSGSTEDLNDLQAVNKSIKGITFVYKRVVRQNI